MLGLFLVVAPAKADPQIQAGDIAAYQAADEDARARILIRLCQAGFVDTAATMMHRFPLQGPRAENRTLYIEGMILEKRGQFPAAAAKFRAALANDPQLTLVRVELAMVLARMNETDSAKHHLVLLRGSLDDPEQRAAVQSFINRLDASHPFSFSGFISLAPSTNINQGSSHDTVYSPGIGGLNGVDPLGTIASGSRAQSGIGITAGANAGFVKPLGHDLQAVLAGGIQGTYYPSTNTSGVTLSQSIELRHLDADGYVGFGGVAQQGMDPDNIDLVYNSFGPRISFLRRVSPRDQITGDATYQWRSYPGSSGSDGTALTVSAVITHAIDAGSNVALITGFEKVDQQQNFNSYKDATLGAGFYKELHHGVTLQGQATARYALFDTENPFTFSTRQDTWLQGSLTLTKRDWNWGGFAPSLNYTYVRNFSNISLYDFDSHSVDFRLTKDF